MMDEGELPVDADGNYVSGVPVDPEDPRTQNMKPAGKISPPVRAAVSIIGLHELCLSQEAEETQSSSCVSNQ